MFPFGLLALILISATSAFGSAQEPWTSPRWLAILHARRDSASEILDPRFFLSIEGRRAPKAEYFAFLASAKEDPTIACRFPARALFARESDSTFRSLDCEQYTRWKAVIEPERVSYIYVAQFLKNPASVFGHSLLRFENRAHHGALAFALSYFAANMESESPLDYVVKGLFGGYHGEFKISPYYQQLNTYGSLESRDIWEYELNLDAHEREYLMAHLWELLENSATRYFFLNRNCAYQMMRVLQVAKPELNLDFPRAAIFVTPQDVAEVLQESGAVTNQAVDIQTFTRHIEYRLPRRMNALSLCFSERI